MSAKGMKTEQKPEKNANKAGKIGKPPKQGGVILLAVVIIIFVALFIWVVNCYAPKDEATPDDRLVKKVVRDQFEAIFEKDYDKFISCFSEDFNNGDSDYSNKVEMGKKVVGEDFEIIDGTFEIRFVESGENQAEVHFDHDRGFATVLTYTYWKQRAADRITRVPAMKLGAFLLRKEEGGWRIISDKSIPLQQSEHVERLINTPQFKPFTDPSTMQWPPRKIVQQTEKEVPEENTGDTEGSETEETGDAEVP
jgi:hypothetical protein